MGCYDCYCALCSGPLGIGLVVFGSTKAKDIRTRRTKIEPDKREPTGGVTETSDDEEMEGASEAVEGSEDAEETALKNYDDDSSDEADKDFEVSSTSTSSSSCQDSEFWENEDSDLITGDIQDVDIPPSEPPSEPEPGFGLDDTWSQASDLPDRQGFDPFHNTDRKDKTYEWYEEHSYDPFILNFDELQWTARCRCLGFNAAAPGATNTFISGRGRYVDYGCFDITKQGRDINDPSKDFHRCFDSYEPDEEPAFPFHEACYKLLSRDLGFVDEKGLDRDVLYRILKQNVDRLARGLSLDYGCIQGANQFWECLPGEEYSVCDPGPRLGFEKVLQSMMPASLFEWAPMTLDITHKVRNDPLAVLPYDILYDIFDHLSTQDTTSLMSASWHVLISTRNTDFWRHLLRYRILPWFWELDSLVTNSTLPSDFNYKQLYLWLDGVTTPEFSMTGPFMGIANRRRIWAVCDQLSLLYKERVSLDENIEPRNDESEAILRSAMSLHISGTKRNTNHINRVHPLLERN